MAYDDRGADGDNKFIAAQGRNKVNAYSASGEAAADSAAVGAQKRPISAGGIGDRPTLPGGADGVLSRPYHGDWRGRLETRTPDMGDGNQIAVAKAEEAKLIDSRADQYKNHGNVGWAGNYAPDWEVEK